MKVFLVIYERDGASRREEGKHITEIEHIQERYAAEYIQDVYDHVHRFQDLIEADKKLLTIHEEHPAITVICNDATPSEQTE